LFLFYFCLIFILTTWFQHIKINKFFVFCYSVNFGIIYGNLTKLIKLRKNKRKSKLTGRLSMSVNPTNIPVAPSVPYFFRPLKNVQGSENCSPNLGIEKAWENKNSYKDILHPVSQDVRMSPVNNPSIFRKVANVIANFFRAAKNWIWNKLGYVNSTKLAERAKNWSKVNDAIVSHDLAPKFRRLLEVPRSRNYPTWTVKMQAPSALGNLFNTAYAQRYNEVVADVNAKNARANSDKAKNDKLIAGKAAHLAKLNGLDERARVAFRKEYSAQTNKAKIEPSKDLHQQVLDRYVEEMNSRKVAQAKRVKF
jgi:hypothetical protein